MRAIWAAKYRSLWERSLPHNMLYQLTIDATTHPQHVVTIRCPKVKRHATESRVPLREPIYGTDIGRFGRRPHPRKGTGLLSIAAAGAGTDRTSGGPRRLECQHGRHGAAGRRCGQALRNPPPVVARFHLRPYLSGAFVVSCQSVQRDACACCARCAPDFAPTSGADCVASAQSSSVTRR